MRRYSIWPRSPSRPMGARFRNGKGGFEKLAVTGAAGHLALHDDLDLIPILGLVLLQVLVGSRHQVVPALKLWPTDENAAVGIDAGTEFELENEVLREFLHGVKLRDQSILPLGEVHGENAVLGGVTASVAGTRFAIELLHDLGDRGGLWGHLGTETPSREVLAVEQASELRVRLPLVGVQRA